jgi:hypothetical protein
LALWNNYGMSNNERTLGDYLDSVHDKETISVFVWALMRDREDAVEAEKLKASTFYVPNAGNWENSRIETSLEAALACVQAVPERLPEEPSWKSFAEFLYGGKIYE